MISKQPVTAEPWRQNQTNSNSPIQLCDAPRASCSPKMVALSYQSAQKIPPESPVNTGRIFNLEIQKNIHSGEIWKEKCSEQLVWIESVALQTRTVYGKNTGRI